MDWSTFGGVRKVEGKEAKYVSSGLVSAGADFTVELGNLTWVPYPFSIGVSASWLGGSYFKTLAEADKDGRKPYYVGLLFSVDL